MKNLPHSQFKNVMRNKRRINSIKGFKTCQRRVPLEEIQVTSPTFGNVTLESKLNLDFQKQLTDSNQEISKIEIKQMNSAGQVIS